MSTYCLYFLSRRLVVHVDYISDRRSNLQRANREIGMSQATCKAREAELGADSCSINATTNTNRHNCTDEDLVLGISTHNVAAESLLFTRYRPRLLKFLQRRGFVDDSEDILHESFIILLAKVREGTLRAPSQVGNYWGAILRNLWIQDIRKRERRRTSLASDWIEEIKDKSATPENLYQQAKENRQVREEVERLNISRDRSLLRDYYLNETGRSAMCAKYGLSEPQLSRVLYRARQRLRPLLEDSLTLY